METGKQVLNEVLSELDYMGLSAMATELSRLYHAREFLQMDRLTLLRQIIGAEFEIKSGKKFANRLKKARLDGSPCDLRRCVNSRDREYLPEGITTALGSLDFVEKGLNVCILGPSDSGKSYLAKALAIQACHSYRVCYTHCSAFAEEMVALKGRDFEKYQRKLRYYTNLDLMVLDDFLLHTITDESEIKALFQLLEKRNEHSRSTIFCSQREPRSWASMMLNDEVSANAILKRATKHYTVVINPRNSG